MALEVSKECCMCLYEYFCLSALKEDGREEKRIFDNIANCGAIWHVNK